MTETRAGPVRRTDRSSQVPRRWFGWLALLGGGVFLIWALLVDWLPPVIAPDISQGRLNIALPPPQGTTQIRQTFLSRRDGLAEVELQLAAYDGPDDAGRLEIQLQDETGRQVAFKTLENRDYNHNQIFRFRFPHQENSAGRLYTLLLSGTAGNRFSVWGYELDAYGDGALELVGEKTAAQELRFVTYYRLSLSGALVILARLLRDNLGLLALALFVMFWPGCLLLTLLCRRLPGSWDGAAWWGAALALGLAAWPLLWLWLTLAGGRWSGWSLWGVSSAGWLGVIALQLRDRGLLNRVRSGPVPTLNGTLRPRFRWHHGLLAVILVLGFAARLLAVRDLAFPPWVDASRHALITTLMAEDGQMLGDYRPLLPVDRVPYHTGFHTLPAALLLMSAVPLPSLLLILGQLLNALVPLTAYAAGWLVTRRPAVGLLAAFLVGLPFFFPAYYATWGRFTQLAAVVVLPVCLALSWLLIRGGRAWRGAWPLVAVLAAGLLLIHFRVFLLYLPFVALVWSLSLGRHTRHLLLAAALALGLTGPATWRLAQDTQPGLPSSFGGYNAFPIGYVTIGWERGFLWLGLAALGLAFAGGLVRRRWAYLPLILAGWVGVVALLLAGGRLGLPETGLINLNSAYIVFFLPLALGLAVMTVQIWRWLLGRQNWWPGHSLGRGRSLWQSGLHLAGGALIAAAILFGLRQQVTILNPETILAWTPDQAGLEWVDENLPPAARIGINAWQWLGTTWAGGDGGAWLLPLTGRETTTPPVDYIYNRRLAEGVFDFNSAAAEITDWADPAAADWLRGQGVTHLFVGARGGALDPAALTHNPGLTPLYGRDGVFVFAVDPVDS